MIRQITNKEVMGKWVLRVEADNKQKPRGGLRNRGLSWCRGRGPALVGMEK